MRKTVGLVGCGVWGINILRDLIALNCRVYVADVDTNARTLANGAEKVFTNSAELPACDGFVVAVPIPDLANECANLLKHKKPIFVEKTLCLSLESADNLEKLSGSKYIFPMHKWHYHPGIEVLRDLAVSERIGILEELFTIRHKWVDDFHGGDALWTLAVHDLTIVKHIFGYIPDKILCANIIQGSQMLPMSLTAVLGEGPVANISVNARHVHNVSRVSIHGAKGSAVLNSAYDDYILVRDEHGEEKINIDTTFPLYLQLKEFVLYLEGGPKPRCDLQSAREITQSLLALRDKAKTFQKNSQERF